MKKNEKNEKMKRWKVNFFFPFQNSQNSVGFMCEGVQLSYIYTYI